MELMKHERTLQEAARRYARLQAADCTKRDIDAAAEWQAENPENRQAYELAERLSTGVIALSADERYGHKLRALADEAFSAYPQSPPSRRNAVRVWRVAAGLVATVAVAAIAAWQIAPHVVSDSAQRVAYESADQERRTLTLADGSIVQLDVDTQIAIRMSDDRRQIELLSGRALFSVAHDSSRPFSVKAAGSRTTALGTKFQVQRDAEQVVVTLTEGSVAVDRADGASGADWYERLAPGEQIDIDGTTQQRLRRFVDVNVTTSWSLGRHIFHSIPLHVAIDEVNRYATRKVRLGDPSLADLPVSGNFIAGDSEMVVDAFAAVLPLRVVEAGDREIILFQNYGR